MHFFDYLRKTIYLKSLLFIEADKHVKLVKIVRQKNHSLLLVTLYLLFLFFFRHTNWDGLLSF